MKSRHIAALVSWYLLMPLAIHAQSQLQGSPPPVTGEPAAASHGNNTLEIPVVVRPNQPPLDLSFVGFWCGTPQFELFESLPSIPTPPQLLQTPPLSCSTFTHSAAGVVFDGRTFAWFGGDTRARAREVVVSESANAVGPREITVSRIVEVSEGAGSRIWSRLWSGSSSWSPLELEYDEHQRITFTTNFKLDSVSIAATSTVGYVKTISYASFRGEVGDIIGTATVHYRASLHRATPSEETYYWTVLIPNSVNAGGGDVAVPRAK